MKKQQFISILDRYLKNQATAEEQNLLHAYYHLFMADDDVLLLLKDEEKEKLKLQIKAEINARIGKIEADVAAERLRRVRLWPRIAVAAAAIAAIVVGVYFFNASRHGNTPRHPELVSGSQDIAPGKNGATITLANGKVIQLSDAKSGVVIGNDLKYSDGSSVGRHPEFISGSRNSKGGGPDLRQDDVMLTASTAKGQTYQFTLPDGTRVWLNADSKISFHSQFSGGDRKILLSGEAYFEVAKMTRKPTKPIDKGTLPREKNGMERVPFMVETDQQIVEVLGTHFNVNSYADEGNTKTTLLEGSVRVLYPARGPAIPSFYRDDVVLEPNQQSVVTGSNRIKVKQVDVDDVISWKSGKFSFASEEIGNIMKQVSRWYDVDVNYTDDVQKIRISGSVSRFANISVLLQKLEQTGLVHFKVEGRKVYVAK